MTAIAEAGTASVENELVARLAGTEERRSAEADRIRTIAHDIDFRRLADVLRDQRLFELLGDRATPIAPAFFQEAVADAQERSRQLASLQTLAAGDLLAELERKGIPALPIKGPLMAERVLGDAGLRSPSTDLDVIVRPDQLDDAVRVLSSRFGYVIHDPTVWSQGLPHYHWGLTPPDPLLPKVELHWRVHWYEKHFACRALARSDVAPNGVRVPRREDELGVLLAIYARDGLLDMRTAVDISAWWDRYGARFDISRFAELMERHPRLRAAWTAAAIGGDAAVGLPLAREPLPFARTRRLERAVRAVDWRRRDASEDVASDIRFIDLMLSPIGAYGTFLRHYYFQPLAHYQRVYGWGKEARLRSELRRIAHATGRLALSIQPHLKRLAVAPQGRDPEASSLVARSRNMDSGHNGSPGRSGRNRGGSG